MRTYAFVDAGSILCCFRQDGRAYLARLDIQARQLSPLDIPFTAVFDPHVADGLAYFLGGSQESASGIVRLDLNTGTFDILRSSSSVSVAAGTLSVAQLIEFPTTGGLSAFAHYYAPQNEAYRGPADERPPLIVMSHGGPTGSATTTFNPEKQFWTSRGFAVLDVDYGGSTGYGRAYRKRLNGTWGVVDVQDCINAAAYLVEQGIVDGDQLAIRGGSAGGYTTLCALTFHDTFAAGASYFGLSDIEVMIKDTHKFEARYLDSLVGPYPERRDLYRDRSPIHFVDQINCPMILFQGLEDKVVLPNQAEMMFEAVKAKGLPVAYLPFAEEQHGFRKAENIKRSLEAELYFYAMVFGFELADEIDPVHIENL